MRRGALPTAFLGAACALLLTLVTLGLPAPMAAASAPSMRTATPGAASPTASATALATPVRPPVPTPTPAATPTPTPPPIPPAPALHRSVQDNWLTGSGVSAPVTDYTDCTGVAPVARASVQVDTCVSSEQGLEYFVGHNVGLFTPLVNAQPGTVMTYTDSDGNSHTYTIRGHQDLLRADGVPPPPLGSTAEFQTCLDAQGTWIRVFYAS